MSYTSAWFRRESAVAPIAAPIAIPTPMPSPTFPMAAPIPAPIAVPIAIPVPVFTGRAFSCDAESVGIDSIGLLGSAPDLRRAISFGRG